jgi:pyruvate formate lyase activating enzyme
MLVAAEPGSGACALPLVADVKRHSLEDGPGIRTVVFFKGCPLRCVFCHNPETQARGPELAFFEDRCLRCGRCAVACPRGAAALELAGRIARERCDRCGSCAAVCAGRALRQVGRYFPPERLVELVLRDLCFYRYSRGGVTLSGGEPTLFPDYVSAVLGPLRRAGVHVALQTCGEFEYDEFASKVLPLVDLVYYDVKLADREAHRRHTGVANDRILANLRRLLRDAAVPVNPRVPLVPGVTAGRDNLAAIAALLREAGARDVTLLPYNPLGLAMATRLGRTRPPLPPSFMDVEEERSVFASFEQLLGASVPRREEREPCGDLHGPAAQLGSQP